MAYKLTSDTGVTVVLVDDDQYVLECYGTVAASTLDTTNTYQKGCIYNKTDGSRYENTGTLVSPSWSLTSPALKSIEQTVTYDQFTDGGGAAGTLELSTDIPVGAIVTQVVVKDLTGFTGDTSATLTVGDGTDVDRYNTGTPSVFTTADAISVGVPSGTAFHSASKTPTLTVTSNADFTSVSAGQLTIVIYYYV